MENLDATLDRPIDGNSVRFYYRRVLDKAKTKKLGRDEFKYRPYVRIKSPKMANQIIDKEVTEAVLLEWKHKIPEPVSGEYIRAYETFKKLDHSQVDGYPLDQWNEISRDRADNLKHQGITTVEVLANVPDSKCGAGPGKIVSLDLRNRAKEFLKGDDERKIRARLAEKDRVIETLQNDLEARKAENQQILVRLANLEKNNEPSDNLRGRPGGDRDSGSGNNSGVERPHGGANPRAGKAKPKGSRKKS